MGKPRRKKKKTVKSASEITDNSVPRSFVFHRGEIGTSISQLVLDMRHLMEPYTATNLKVLKSNVLKDFVNVAGPYGISHFLMFSKTEVSPYMKICRLPRGPTLTFRVDEYSLMRDITSILKRPKTIGKQFKCPPLVVLNGFNVESSEMKLMTTVFQNMFASIQIQKVKLGEIRRCVMFNYNKDTGCIDFRHYNIEAVPVGISRGVKKLLKNKIPNLGSLNDISDFMTGAAYLSESEGEEPAESHIILPQRVPGRGNMKAGQSAIRLTEMGPRMKLELIKIEEGLCNGEVLFHKYVQKSEKEIKLLKRKREQARKLKEQRKREQEQNIAKKEKGKVEHKAKSLAGMKRKADEQKGDESDDEDDDQKDVEKVDSTDDDDDVEYYRQEVGDEPDDDVLRNKKPKKFVKRKEEASRNTKKTKFVKKPGQLTQNPKFKTKISKNSKGIVNRVRKNDVKFKSKWKK